MSIPELTPVGSFLFTGVGVLIVWPCEILCCRRRRRRRRRRRNNNNNNNNNKMKKSMLNLVSICRRRRRSSSSSSSRAAVQTLVPTPPTPTITTTNNNHDDNNNNSNNNNYYNNNNAVSKCKGNTSLQVPMSQRFGAILWLHEHQIKEQHTKAGNITSQNFVYFKTYHSWTCHISWNPWTVLV